MPNRPTLRQLEYLVAVADLRSFHRAAERCAVTQPGLSAQVRQLEALLEVRLFERDRRRVLVTAAGEEMVDRARDILASTDDLVEMARTFHSPLTGARRLGVIPTVAPYLLPRALRRVRERYPQLRLLLREAQTVELVREVAAGSMDVALLALEADLGALESHPLFLDRFRLVVPRGHRLAKQRTVCEQDLDTETVLLLEDGHCLREQAWAVCERGGATELGDFRATSLTTLVQMVASGIGVTLLPELSLDVEVGKRDDLVTLPFRPPAPSRTVGLVWRPTSARKRELRMLGKLMGEERKTAARSQKSE